MLWLPRRAGEPRLLLPAGGGRVPACFEVTTARVNHPVETSGFRFRQSGRMLTYSADTGESPALVRMASQADLLLSEASFLDGLNLPRDLHLTARCRSPHRVTASTWAGCFDVGRFTAGQASTQHPGAAARRHQLTSRASRAKGRGRAVARPVAVVLPGTRINDHACTRDRRRRIHRLASHRCPADQGR